MRSQQSAASSGVRSTITIWVIGELAKQTFLEWSPYDKGEAETQYRRLNDEEEKNIILICEVDTKQRSFVFNSDLNKAAVVVYDKDDIKDETCGDAVFISNSQMPGGLPIIHLTKNMTKENFRKKIDVIFTVRYLAGLRREEKKQYDEAIEYYIAEMNDKGNVAAYERLIWLCSQTNLSEQSLLKIEKAQLFKLIKSIKSVDRQVMLLLQCLNDQTLLGKRFWQPDWGGMRAAALDRGELDNICQYLIQINAGYKQIIEGRDFLIPAAILCKIAAAGKSYVKDDDSKIALYQKAILVDPINASTYRQKIGPLYYMMAQAGYFKVIGQQKSIRAAIPLGKKVSDISEPIKSQLLGAIADLKRKNEKVLTNYVQAINHHHQEANKELKLIFKDGYFDQRYSGDNFFNEYSLKEKEALFRIIMILNEEHRPAFLLLCFDASTKIGQVMLGDKPKPDINEGVFKQIYGELIRIDSNYQRTISQLLSEEENRQLSEVYCKTGEVSYKLKVIDEAIAAYTQAITVNPHCGPAYIALSDIYAHEKKDDAQALIYYTQALAIMPSASLYDERGLSYGKLKRYEEAIEDFNKAIELSEHSGFKLKARFYNNQGSGYVVLGNYEAALTSLNKSIEQNPNLITAHTNIGYVYRVKGDYDNALVAYKKAIEISDKKKKFGFAPPNYSAFLGIGSIYYDQERYVEALEKFDALLSQARLTSSESSPVYYKRGLTNEALKKYEDAVDDYINASERGYVEATNYLWLFLQKDLPLSDSLSKKIRDHLREAFKKTEDERLKHLDSTNVDHHLSALSENEIHKKMAAIRKILCEDIWRCYWVAIHDGALLKIYKISIDKDKDDKTKYQKIIILVKEANSGIHLSRADILDDFYKYFYQIESAGIAKYFAKKFYRAFEANEDNGVVYGYTIGENKWLSFLNTIIELDPKEEYYMARVVFISKTIAQKRVFSKEQKSILSASLKMVKQQREFKDFSECEQFAKYYYEVGLFQEALDCYIEFSRHHRDICCLPMARLYQRLNNHREALLQYHWFCIVSDNTIQNEGEIKAFLNNLVEQNGFDDSKKDEVQVTALSSDGDMRMLKALMNKMSLEAVYDFKNKMKEKMPVLLEKLEELTSCEQSSVTVSQTSLSFLQRIGNSVGLMVEEEAPQANFKMKKTYSSDSDGL